MITLKNKVALITGAGHKTGRAIAKALALEGAIIAANDITPINLDATVAVVREAGGQIRDYLADVSKKMAVQRLVNAVFDDLGRLDIVVHCANVEPKVELLDMDEWDLQRTINVNLGGAFLMTQIAGRTMREAGKGVIIHVVRWEAGREGSRAAAYASKIGVLALVSNASAELSRVNVRLYGIFQSDDCLTRVASAGMNQGRLKHLSKEVASVVLSLCQVDSSVQTPIICVPEQKKR